MLLNSPLLRYVKDITTDEQYKWLKRVKSSDHYMLDCQLVIAPLRFGVLQKDLRSTLNWINEHVVLNLPTFLYYPGPKTLGVLLRIATGMINNLDLSEETKREVHMNVIHNVERECRILELESLPFQGIES